MAAICFSARFTLALIAVALWSSTAFAAPPPLGQARISLTQGEVLIQTPDVKDWAATSPNFSLLPGDRLWSASNGRAEVQFGDGSHARIGANTGLDLVALERSDTGNIIQLALTQGVATFFVREPSVPNSLFQVDTPTHAIRAYHDAKFRVDAREREIRVLVFKGDVKVEGKEGATEIYAGEIFIMHSDGRTEIAALPPKDAWDRWVDQIDAERARRASARYLPAEMEPYAYEFDTYGRWVSYPEYGNVWVPRVAVGWAPYRDGRWVWRGGVRVWVGFEPWGWGPYHYGRWRHISGIGWGWIPPLAGHAYWGPGYVSWIETPDYVSWVALAPGELYYYNYAGFYFGPWSVNLAVTPVATVNVAGLVYVNTFVTGAVVALPTYTLLYGVAPVAAVVIPPNPFAVHSVFLGVSTIRPVYAAYIPRPTYVVAAAYLPPAHLRVAPVWRADRVVVSHATLHRSAFVGVREVRAARVSTVHVDAAVRANRATLRATEVQNLNVKQTRLREENVKKLDQQKLTIQRQAERQQKATLKTTETLRVKEAKPGDVRRTPEALKREPGPEKRPPGWDKGKKEGWTGTEPPGLEKKRERAPTAPQGTAEERRRKATPPEGSAQQERKRKATPPEGAAQQELKKKPKEGPGAAQKEKKKGPEGEESKPGGGDQPGGEGQRERGRR
ncbi:MAG: FecR domain-containing protein [Nitrospirae bacterium]|nr:FecR domain-containing protein [Nitrospirota bacterium]